MRNNFDSIKNELTSFINKFKVLSIRQRQALFLQCIMSFDKTFFDYLMNSNEDAHIYYSEVLRYGYPIFIRNFYDKDFETLDGIGLTRITPKNQEICQKILWSCKTLGWIEYIEKNKKYNNFSVCHFGNTTRVKFKKKHYWNEYLEKNHTLLYSKIMKMAHQEQYEELEKEKTRILEKCVLWFMFGITILWVTITTWKLKNISELMQNSTKKKRQIGICFNLLIFLAT